MLRFDRVAAWTIYFSGNHVYVGFRFVGRFDSIGFIFFVVEERKRIIFLIELLIYYITLFLK